jgi:hypothetical protein
MMASQYASTGGGGNASGFNFQGAGAGSGVGSGLGGLTGGIYALSGLAGPGGMEEYKHALEVWKQLQDPESGMDWSKVTPQDLHAIKQWLPQVYENAVPEAVKAGIDSPDLAQAQTQSLQQMQQVAREGLPLEERLAAQEGQDATRQAYRQAVEGSLRNLQSRGRYGGGEELAARLAGGQQSANLARDQGNDLARQAVANRLNAITASNQMAGQQRAQQYGISADQANTYNNFNQWLAQFNTQPRQYAAQVGNQAGLYNSQNAQNIQNYNAQNRQAVQGQNIDRTNQNRLALADWRLRRTQGLSGAYGNLGQAKDAEKAGNIAAVSGIGSGVGSLGGGLLGGLL